MGILKSKPSSEKIGLAAENACRMLEKGDAKAALKRLDRCAGIHREGWALLLRARIKQSMGLDSLAIADVTRAFDRDPDCGWIFDLPIERLKIPNIPNALTLYRMNRAFRKEAGSYAVHAFVGKLKTMRGLEKEGLMHLDWAVNRHPRQAYLLTWRAEIRRRLKHPGAERDLEAALRLEPRQFVAHAAYAALLRERGEHRRALEHARASWKFSSTYETGALEAARISLALGDARSTFLWLERAVKRANRYGWKNIGRFKDFERLAQDPALKKKIWKSRWLAWCGEALLGMGQSEEAAALLKESLTLDSRFAWAWAWMGEAAESEGFFKRALRLDPSYTRAWLDLGRLELSRGRNQKALNAFDRAVAIDPVSALSRYWRAAAWKKLGRVLEAQKDLQEALKLDPKFKQAKVLQNQLRAETHS